MGKHTGGPAFPTDNAHQNGPSTFHYEGMTLRDYFAASASEEDVNEHIWKGFKENYVVNRDNGTSYLATRQAAWTREEAKYRYADAMLKAREAA